MADITPARELEILIVEDNPLEVRMMQEALKLSDTPHRLHVAEDGELALAFLRRAGRYPDAPPPDLVLLDLKLPKLNGFAVLAAIRGNKKLKRLTVVVFTGSSLVHDQVRSHEFGADHYVTKPAGLRDYVATMKRVRELVITP